MLTAVTTNEKASEAQPCHVTTLSIDLVGPTTESVQSLLAELAHFAKKLGSEKGVTINRIFQVTGDAVSASNFEVWEIPRQHVGTRR
jgi:hypothetical protein